MSGDEMREQEMRLRIEIEDAEKHLAHLKLRAQTHGDMLISLGVKMQNEPETIFRHGVSILYGHPPSILSVVDDRLVKALEVQGILKQADEIRESTEKLNTLRGRLAKLR
jgi:hypothetical protein